MDKQNLVKQITDLYPALGVEKGWSWYVGGMKDTGDWYEDKVMAATEEELVSFLEDVKKKENDQSRVGLCFRQECLKAFKSFGFSQSLNNPR